MANILCRQALLKLNSARCASQIRNISLKDVPAAIAPHWSFGKKKKEVQQKELVVGQVFTTDFKDAVEIQVKKMVLDELLWMYFSEKTTIFAEDPQSLTKDGDIVLIKELKEKIREEVTHEVVQVLYPLGDITDPISGEKCVSYRYRDDTEAVREAYGTKEDSQSFVYKDAPPRGWQEGNKDFSHKVGYRKWNEFEPGHPLHKDPTAS